MKERFMSCDGRYVYTRESRWIQIRYAYVTKRHSLYDYADHLDDDCLSYFIHKGRRYAMGQFVRFGYPFKIEGYDRTFRDKKGYHMLSGYDATDCYKPFLIEVSDDGEYVRLYSEEVLA